MSDLTSDVNNYPGVGLYIKPGAKKFSCFCVGEKTPKVEFTLLCTTDFLICLTGIVGSA